MGVRERSGTGSVRADSAAAMRGSNATMRGPSTDGRGGNVGSAPQNGGRIACGNRRSRRSAQPHERSGRSRAALISSSAQGRIGTPL